MLSWCVELDVGAEGFICGLWLLPVGRTCHVEYAV